MHPLGTRTAGGDLLQTVKHLEVLNCQGKNSLEKEDQWHQLGVEQGRQHSVHQLLLPLLQWLPR